MSCLVLLLLFVVVGFLSSQFQALVVLPVTRDDETLQFVTTVHLWTPPLPIKLVVDLGGPFLWVDSTVTCNPISRCSVQCFKAKNFVDDPDGSKICFYKQLRTGPVGNCIVIAGNSIAESKAKGILSDCDLNLSSNQELNDPDFKVQNFIFSTASSSLLTGLAAGTRGMLGLGRSSISLLSQVSNAISSQRKLFMCLSSPKGFIQLGDADLNEFSQSKIANLLIYTPMFSTHNRAGEYLIKATSIKISNKELAIDFGYTQISTIIPYTKLASSIFVPFVRSHELAAATMNLTKVSPFSPFKLCFRDEGTDKTRLGPHVPSIDLVFQSELVRWSFTGSESMVRVSEGIMCLAFVDGGSAMDGSEISIVLGGHQLVDNLIELDVGRNMVGFSRSLLMKESSCSDIIMSKGHALS